MIYNIQTSYKTYRQLSKIESIVSIDRYIYFAICNDFMLFMVGKILDGFKIRFPEKLGVVQIIGNKQVIKMDNGISHNKVDWKKTNDMWLKNPQTKIDKKLVYYTNEHSKGYIYRLKWFKNNAILINKSIYNLVVSKSLKRKIAKEINNNKEYCIINTINSIAVKK